MNTRRALLLSVYVPSALLAFSDGLLLPTLPLYALQFDVSYAVAALVIAASGIGTMFADIPAGMALGRFGLKRTMLAGTAIVAIALFALGYSSFLPLLIFYRLADGVGRSMWAISRVSYITEAIDPLERGRAISVFGGLIALDHLPVRYPVGSSQTHLDCDRRSFWPVGLLSPL